MAKIVISSLFTYDPLVCGFQSGRDLSETDYNELNPSEEIDLDIARAVHHRLSKRVIKELVDSVMLCVMKKEIDNLILLMDNRTDPLQEEALKILQSRIGDSAQIEIIRVNGNDTLSVAREVVNSIDSFDPKTDEIRINISSLKHTKTLGMIYGSYVRSEKVKEIMYVEKEDRRVVNIPKLSLTLTKNQRKILQYFKDLECGKIEKPKKKLYDLFKVDKSSFYYIINLLKDKGLLDDGNKLTDMGEVALL
ncbi:hypothetical protein DRJ17_00885 [Candidatus Woesearchaeota archaeon]|nr:MAG: hypothetical protein DRJ17_00885 [Candidatus Woesearchaeota archaeon]